MTDDDDLKLNSLHRFAKHSKLVLESYDSCEVPAGCGGAVLQWVNPQLTVPLRIDTSLGLFAEKTLLDEQPLMSRAQVPPGHHVLAIRLTPAKNQREKLPPFLLVAIGRVMTPQEIEPLPGGMSAADGTWLATATVPPESWASLGFDDRSWKPLRASRVAASQLPDWFQHRFEQLTSNGAVALEVPAKGAWVRKRFTVAGRET